MRDPGFSDVLLFNRAGSACRRLKTFRNHGISYFEETRFLPDGFGLFPAELYAIVLSRIMTGGNHDTTGQLVVANGEIDHIAGNLTDVYDIAALRLQPLDEGIRQLT